MRRSRFLLSLCALAALATPLLAGPEEEGRRDAVQAVRAGTCEGMAPELAPAVPEPPVLALLAAGLALGLARGKGGVRRPVRRRRG